MIHEVKLHTRFTSFPLMTAHLYFTHSKRSNASVEAVSTVMEPSSCVAYVAVVQRFQSARHVLSRPQLSSSSMCLLHGR